MEIKKISVFQVDIPIIVPYKLGGRWFRKLDSTIVEIETRSGIKGYGESCPWGWGYNEGYPLGVRPGIYTYAPSLIGEKVCNHTRINYIMDRELVGQSFCKAAVDSACYDAQGKIQDLPAYELLGGGFDGATPIAATVSAADTAEETLEYISQLREKWGIFGFSFKLTGNIDIDIPRLEGIFNAANPGDIYIADANRTLSLSAALVIMKYLDKWTDKVKVVVEQPCKTIEACAIASRRTSVPCSIDELLVSMEIFNQALFNGDFDFFGMKVDKVGGMTRAKQMIDMCALHGREVSIQVNGGSQINKAVAEHVAQATPNEIRHSYWDPTDLCDTQVASGSSPVTNGTVTASNRPGLGIEVDRDVLGDPEAVFE